MSTLKHQARSWPGEGHRLCRIRKISEDTCHWRPSGFLILPRSSILLNRSIQADQRQQLLSESQWETTSDHTVQGAEEVGHRVPGKPKIY